SNVNVVDVVRGEIINDVNVLVRDGIIADITEKQDVSGECGIIDGQGKYLCPGVMDMHVHLVWDGSPDPVSSNVAEGPYLAMLRAMYNAQHSLRKGVTVVRDVGCNQDVTIFLAHAMKKGLTWGCEIIPCGSAITGSCGHVPSLSRIADTDDELIKAVRTLKSLENKATLKCQWVKVMATGGACGPEDVGPSMYSVENLKTIVEEAHRLHMKVSAHALPNEGIRACIEAGIDTIEHGADISVPDLITMKEKGITLIPTLWIYKILAESGDIVDSYMSRKAAQVVEQQKVTFHNAMEQGVRIALGTDAGSPNFGPHPNVFGEMYVMNEYGMDKVKVLQSATITAADVLGIADRKGAIEVGKEADVLLLNGNPFDDLHVFETGLEKVFQRGVLIH
ncbi:amidohydrolase family protein, partial [Megasphaera elsdenii]|uniref:metal-dependent hydrolase family protein n=2 Tax=Megasphaera TaxID=906 RepID=UPI003CFF76BD